MNSNLKIEQEGFSTRAIRIGQEPDADTRSIAPPLVATSTFAKKNLAEEIPYVYGRGKSPTRERWERCIASLEEGKYGLAFSSGMAAIVAVLSLLGPGDRIIATSNIYGGTYRFFEKMLKRQGVQIEYVPTWDFKSVEKALGKSAKMVYLETPSNPLMRVSDIEAITEVAHLKNALVVVDNTFLSPYYQRPLTLGADIVLHSATKYLGGHSDLISGCVITNSDDLYDSLREFQNTEGAIPSAFDCWLLLRSVKTLAVRMEKHNANATEIAQYLAKNPLIRKTIYPGLKNHPDYEIINRQQKTCKDKVGYGGMISLEFEGRKEAEEFLNNLKIFTLAESLGGVESLAGYPFIMSHAGVPEKERLKMGIHPGMVRLSVGIEDVKDLFLDIKQALGV